MEHKIKVPHAMRYFLPVGLALFFFYWKGLYQKELLFFMAPILYLCSIVKTLLAAQVAFETGSSQSVLGLVLPMTIVYFGGFSFLLKNLLVEQGAIKIGSIVGMFTFLGYIHYTAWVNLQGYYLPPY